MKKSVLFLFFVILAASFSAQTNYHWGEFRFTKRINHFDSVDKPVFYFASAFLYNDTVSTFSPLNFGWNGDPRFNGVSLIFDEQIKMYHDTIHRDDYEGSTWELLNSSMSFSTTCQDSFPSFTNLYLLPDTLSRSDSLHLELDDIAYADEIELTIYDGVFRIYMPYNRHLPVQSVLSISSDELSELTGEYAFITLSLIKYEFQVLNGNQFKFCRRLDIVRTMPIID